MNTRSILFVNILVGGLLTFSCKGPQSGNTSAKENKRPNIVIILSDDQGYGDVSYQAHPSEVSTPAIDNLASEGIVFTNGYASAYVCAPTRAGLLTGRYQQRRIDTAPRGDHLLLSDL